MNSNSLHYLQTNLLNSKACHFFLYFPQYYSEIIKSNFFHLQHLFIFKIFHMILKLGCQIFNFNKILNKTWQCFFSFYIFLGLCVQSKPKMRHIVRIFFYKFNIILIFLMKEQFVHHIEKK